MLLRQIKYFVTVVDTGSFTEAAEECFISQSAISQQILSLEKELGVQLLVRRRRFTLTEPGKYLYSHGKKLLGETEKLKNGTIAAAAGQEGSLKVCYLNSFADDRLYKAVSMFKQQNAGVRLNVSGGTHFKEMYVGKSLPTYDSMIVLTHFKGHASGGFGGSLKNIAIGCADAKVGKAMQHGGTDFSIRGAHFMEHMVEAGKAVTDFFGKRIAYVNVMRRMSVRCDCAGPDVEEPTIGDIGMVASTDLLAIDQACVDMVYDKPGGDNKDLIERIESREGLRQLSYMKELKMGNPNYELISID